MLVLASLPAWADPSTLRLFVEFACLLALAQMWNLLAGYGGLVSVGQQGYLGVGGYALVVAADLGGLNPFLCVPLAGVVAALVAVPTSRIVFRLQGGYFAIGTWVVAESLRLVASNTAAVGGGTGTSLISIREFPKSHARVGDVLDRARGGSSARSRRSTGCSVRGTASHSPRSATASARRRARAWTSPRPSSGCT